MTCHRLLLLFAVFAFAIGNAGRADWPEFRGPNSNGHVQAESATEPVGLPLTWSETENVRWKTPIPHKGWSTPVVMDGQIWLTTATEDGREYSALCVDAETGEVVHNKHLFHHDNPEPLGNPLNCYAAPSPAIESGRVYVHFGSYGTACLDTKSGDVLWKREDLPCRHYRGPSSSVVRFENLVILTFDGVDQQYTAALDKQTGDTVWKVDRDVEWNDQNFDGQDERAVKRIRDGDHRKAHCTPLIVTLPSGSTQMISPGAKSAFAYDPRSGDEIWRVTYDDFSVAPRPIYRDGILYMVTGITHPELWAIRLGATGNLTDSDSILWRLNAGVAKTASPLLIDGLIYMISDDGIVNCVDAETGDEVWKKRIGGAVASSPIYADGRIYFSDQEGETTVIKPGRKFEELAVNVLDDGCMASPAVAGSALYLRTKSHLYRIEETKPGD
jgi:outer membrane protein assembly factor BamB